MTYNIYNIKTNRRGGAERVLAAKCKDRQRARQILAALLEIAAQGETYEMEEVTDDV